MYMVLPRMLKAAAHLLNPMLKFDVDGTVPYVAAKDLAAAAQATWVLITNLSSINKLVLLLIVTCVFLCRYLALMGKY